MRSIVALKSFTWHHFGHESVAFDKYVTNGIYLNKVIWKSTELSN